MFLGLPVLLPVPVCFLQGDRGYEGPKGSRGPPGIGYKGDKVQFIVRMTVKELQTSVYCYDEQFDPSPVWPSGKYRSSWGSRFNGVSRARNPRRKGMKMLGIYFPY